MIRKRHLILALVAVIVLGGTPVLGIAQAPAPTQGGTATQTTSPAPAPVKKHRFRYPRHGPVEASWYGPGFYGKPLGCPHKGTLGYGGMGVANKTLPCGTRLRMCYKKHCTRVTVNDRGPYAGDRVFDLQAGAKRKLHFPSTGSVRYERVRR